MVELLGYSVDEVAATLFMSPRTIERYISKCLNTGDVNSEKLGRPFNSFTMHPHVELVIMEAILEQPDNSRRDCLQCLWTDRVRKCCVQHLTIIKRVMVLPAKRFALILIFFNIGFIFFFNLHQSLCDNWRTFNNFCYYHFFTKLSKIALQRSKEARILFRSNVCLLDPEIFVFLDESGFVSFYWTFITIMFALFLLRLFWLKLTNYFCRTKDFLVLMAIAWSVQEPQSNVMRRTGDCI